MNIGETEEGVCKKCKRKRNRKRCVSRPRGSIENTCLVCSRYTGYNIISNQLISNQ